MRNTKYLVIILGLLIPYLLIYRAFFITGELSFADAPYFYVQNLLELFNKPLLWDYRVDNFGAGQEKILWLYLPTFLMGLLYKIFEFGHETSVRLIFFIPASLLAIFGSWMFISIFSKNLWSRFLGTFLYSFNTYNLMIVDGGQIGVALAYGLFPLAAFAVQRFITKMNVASFIFATLNVFLLSNTDIRVLLMLILLYFILYIFKSILSRDINYLLKFICRILPVLAVVLLLDAFWTIPFMLGFNMISNSALSNLDLTYSINIVNPLLLYHPQFPLNEFGTVIRPPVYFGILPVLIFFGIMFKKSNRIQFEIYFGFLLSYLIFLFLTKGYAAPYGGFYEIITNNIPLGVAFRDSTKFFIPLFLLASVLIAINLDLLCEKAKSVKVFYLLVFVIYLFLLFLIHPAITNKLTGVLNINQQNDESMKIIYNNIYNQQRFFRTLWFPVKPQKGYADWQKPATSAIDLYKDLPFALMINGNYDLFNYLHSPIFTDWMKLLGLKYVFFPESSIKKVPTDQSRYERTLFLDFINSIPGLNRIYIGTLFPVYEVQGEINEKIFTHNKTIIVLGDGSIYSYLKDKINFDLTKMGFLLLEDGILDPNMLLSLPRDSFLLLFHNRDMNDLRMVFLQDRFISLSRYDFRQWGYFAKERYLDLKNELTKNGINTYELGFRQGMIYSSVAGEKTQYRLSALESGEHYLIIRSISANGNGNVKIRFAGREYILKNSTDFVWNIYGPMVIEKQSYKLELENESGFHGVDAIILVPKNNWDIAQTKSMNLVKNSQVFNSKIDEDMKQVDLLSKQVNLNDLTYIEINPTKYQVTLSNHMPTWVVFSDHYNTSWRINESNMPYPAYSMINSFWISEIKDRNIILEYTPQKVVDKSLLISLLSAVSLIIGLIFIKIKKQ